MVKQHDGTREQLYLGVHSVINHKSETQLSGLKKQMQDICNIYNGIGFTRGPLAEPGDFARRLRGANTDHAADQKKLVNLLDEWRRRSE